MTNTEIDRLEDAARRVFGGEQDEMATSPDWQLGNNLHWLARFLRGITPVQRFTQTSRPDEYVAGF